jgi:hypothetical protein
MSNRAGTHRRRRIAAAGREEEGGGSGEWGARVFGERRGQCLKAGGEASGRPWGGSHPRPRGPSQWPTGWRRRAAGQRGRLKAREMREEANDRWARRWKKKKNGGSISKFKKVYFPGFKNRQNFTGVSSSCQEHSAITRTQKAITDC